MATGVSTAPLTLGVEEEFHVVDLESRQVVPRASVLLDALPSEGFSAELQRSVVETNTPVASTLGDLRHHVGVLRGRLVEAARAEGLGIAAAGTMPLADARDLSVTADARYARMLADYQILAREQIICGAQVHVGIEDANLRVQIAARVSPDLSILLALSASSPFWQGVDTGYASYRTFVWSRWPTAGSFGGAHTADEYAHLVRRLIATGVVGDAGMMYFDVRPSAHVPTLELRLCDACPRVDDVVLIAGLFRALVRRAWSDIEAGRPRDVLPVELLRAAVWRAARSGLEGDLVDLRNGLPLPAEDVVRSLLHDLRPHLEAEGDWETVSELAADALLRGTSSTRQRGAFHKRAELSDVVDLLLFETGTVDAAPDPTASGTAGGPTGPAAARQLLADYAPGEGDEAVTPAGVPRPASRQMIALLDGLGPERLLQLESARDRHQTERDVTFVVDGEIRPFPIDLVPRIIARSDWDRLQAGLRQRAQALEMFLADVYGPRRAVQEGVVPAEAIERAPGLRPRGALVPDGVVRAVVVGVDVVRDATGDWVVLEDNLRVPSGLAYAMQARRLIGSVVPGMDPPAGTLEVTGAIEALGRALRDAAPEAVGSVARVALLTSGPADSAWWEHRELAERMGVDIVQPKDLIVLADGVYRQSVGRQIRIDVVYRRFDEDLLDHVAGADGRPLGRRLLTAVARGQLTLANAPGNGVADDKAVYAYVPALIDFYLSEKPLLRDVRTLLCADAAQRAEVLDRMAELVLKPVDGYGGSGVTIGPAASGPELDDVRREVLLAPTRWVAQELVSLSTHPTLRRGRLEARHVDLRAFVVLSPGPASSWTGGLPPPPRAQVLAAPLTRMAPEGSLVVNSSRGGGAKDTWIVP